MNGRSAQKRVRFFFDDRQEVGKSARIFQVSEGFDHIEPMYRTGEVGFQGFECLRILLFSKCFDQSDLDIDRGFFGQSVLEFLTRSGV